MWCRCCSYWRKENGLKSLYSKECCTATKMLLLPLGALHSIAGQAAACLFLAASQAMLDCWVQRQTWGIVNRGQPLVLAGFSKNFRPSFSTICLDSLNSGLHSCTAFNLRKLKGLVQGRAKARLFRKNCLEGNQCVKQCSTCTGRWNWCREWSKAKPRESYHAGVRSLGLYGCTWPKYWPGFPK